MDAGPSDPEKKAQHRLHFAEEEPGLEVYNPPPPTSREKVDDTAPEAYFSDEASKNTTNFTFYREGTPTPPEYPSDHDQEKTIGDRAAAAIVAGDVPYFEPPPTQPKRDRKCGIRRRLCWIVIAVLVFGFIAIAVGVGVGAGLAARVARGASDAASSSSSTTTSNTSATSTASSPRPTSTSTSTDECPAMNDTIYAVPDSDKKFLRICGVDFGGIGEAVDLSHLPTKSFAECMNNCAGTTACTGCAWGFIKGEKGNEHQCWMKSTLQKSHKAIEDWNFAILQ